MPLKHVLGILGGMGPLASAEFLRTIYELNIGSVEQDAPVCLLYSDPSIPDRTDAILNGREDLLLDGFVNALDALCRMGADRIVIACITIHHLLPRVPPTLRQRIISLVDVIIDEVLASDENHLLLCTSGTRRAAIFEKHCRWELIKSKVVLPNESDQRLIHDLLQTKLKTNQNDDTVLARLNDLVQRYRTRSFIAGCTEFHLVVKRIMSRNGNVGDYGFVDPLLTIARDCRKLVNTPSPYLL